MNHKYWTRELEHHELVRRVEQHLDRPGVTDPERAEDSLRERWKKAKPRMPSRRSNLFPAAFDALLGHIEAGREKQVDDAIAKAQSGTVRSLHSALQALRHRHRFEEAHPEYARASWTEKLRDDDWQYMGTTVEKLGMWGVDAELLNAYMQAHPAVHHPQAPKDNPMTVLRQLARDSRTADAPQRLALVIEKMRKGQTPASAWMEVKKGTG